MCETKYHYNPKALKKKFKNMTQCFECGHLDGFESCTGVDRIPCCAGCGSTNIRRRPTIELTRTWIPAKWWRENRAPTGEESVQNKEVPPVESLKGSAKGETM